MTKYELEIKAKHLNKLNKKLKFWATIIKLTKWTIRGIADKKFSRYFEEANEIHNELQVANAKLRIDERKLRKAEEKRQRKAAKRNA